MNDKNRYAYEELKEAALAPGATQEDLAALSDWFYSYDMRDWNGEYFEIDATHRLYPIHGEEDSDGNIPIIAWEIL